MLTPSSSPRLWTQIDLKFLSPAIDFEIASAHLWSLGIEATEEIPEGIRFYLAPGELPQSILKALTRLCEKSRTSVPFEIKTSSIEEKDWMEEWKKHFDVLQLTKHIWICPSWKTFHPKTGDVVIHMDPGMAFGTGHHPSTTLIAQAMDEKIEKGMAVLDVGTGTGVLAMGAALLGASHVVAIDTDPEARWVARNNIALNQLTPKIEVSDYPITKLRRKFDLVVANILAEVHAELFREYAKRLSPNGLLLLSGVIIDRAELVRTQARLNNWIVVSQREQGEWVCMALITERRKNRRS